MGKLICLKFEEKKTTFVYLIFFSRENIIKLEKLDRGGIVDVVKATVDILLVQSGFQYYFLFCLNKLVLS